MDNNSGDLLVWVDLISKNTNLILNNLREELE